jgi:sugar O-acyltransferase (sialic acid O-acetyltransferase NeuD family)
MTFYIVGAGGFGRETLDALRAASPAAVEPAVFLDDHPSASEIDGIPVRRPEEADPGVFVVAIADPVARRRLTDALLARGYAPGQVIHPRSVVSARAALGPGCVVLAGAFVSTSTVLGAHVQVNYNATIGHDTVLGDFVTVLPAANVAGAVTVGPAATLGSNACVLPGLRIGPGATVGAGAVVTRDVPDGAVVIGAPARPLRLSRPRPSQCSRGVKLNVANRPDAPASVPRKSAHGGVEPGRRLPWSRCAAGGGPVLGGWPGGQAVLPLMVIWVKG